MIFLEMFKHQSDMRDMVLTSSTVYKYIVKENKLKLMQIRLKQVVHYSLEGSWCIGQVKRHD